MRPRSPLSYNFLEQPIRSWHLLDRYRTQVIAVGLSISLVVVLVIAPTILRWNTTARQPRPRCRSPAEHPYRQHQAARLALRANDIPALPHCLHAPIAKCTVVHGKGPSVLLIGDSLARMWLPCSRIVERESLTLTIAVFPSCPWQPGLKNGLAMSPQCPGHRADWYAGNVP